MRIQDRLKGLLNLVKKQAQPVLAQLQDEDIWAHSLNEVLDLLARLPRDMGHPQDVHLHALCLTQGRMIINS